MSAPKASVDLSVANTAVAVVAPGPCSVVTVQQKQGSDPPSYPFKVLALDGTTVLSTQQGGTNFNFVAPPGMSFFQGQTVGYIKILVAGPATFTVFADPVFGPAAPITQSSQVTLTSAQLKALQTTAIQLAPNPGPGRMLVPLRLTLQHKFKTLAYTIGNADNAFQLEYVGQSTALLAPAATGLMDQSADTIITQAPAVALAAIARAVSENLGLELLLVGTTPALTGATAAGTMVATLYYAIVPLA